MPYGMNWERYKQYCISKFIDRWFWQPIIDEYNRRFYIDYEFRKTYKPKRYENDAIPIGEADWMENNIVDKT